MSKMTYLQRLGLLAGAAFVVALSAATMNAQTPRPAAAAAPAAGPQVTFHKDIEPILQRSCQRCHNPNSVAPMALMTYQQVRPYARAIKQRTAMANEPYARGAMPPWYLEKTVGVQKVKDDISLSQEEIELIAKWADSGAPQGNPADAPPAIKLLKAGEWAFGQPDLIVSSPTIYVPAMGSDWSGSWGKSPLGLTEDRYALSAEFHEVNSKKMGTSPSLNGRYVIHHATTSITGPDDPEEAIDHLVSRLRPILRRANALFKKTPKTFQGILLRVPAAALLLCAWLAPGCAHPEQRPDERRDICRKQS